MTSRELSDEDTNPRGTIEIGAISDDVDTLKNAVKTLQCKVDAELNSLKIELIAQDHRTLSVWRNFLKYRKPESDQERFGAAAGAAVRWFFTGGRATLVLSLGGIAAILLTIQANRLLKEQNLKLDLQNRLIIIQSHQEEARRSIQLGRGLDPLIRNVFETKTKCSGRVADKLSSDHGPCLAFNNNDLRITYCIEDGEELTNQLEAFSHVVQPYRIVIGDEQEAIEGMRVPQLSEFRLSPERGDLMRRLLAEQRISKALQADRPGMTFDKAFLPPGSKLIGVDLAYAQVRRADLTGVRLEHSFAADADFEGAVLNGAVLKCATLTNTRLNGTKLQDASLEWSSLSSADMSRADLGGAILRYAEMDNAKLYFTNLRGADLEGVKGLTHPQIKWACLDSKSELPEIEGFSFESYRPLRGCVVQWGEGEEAGEWIALESKKPPVGVKVVVKVVVFRKGLETEHEMYGRWDGDWFRTDRGLLIADREKVLSTSWKHEIALKSTDQVQ